MKKTEIRFLDGEKWWGGVVQHSILMPFTAASEYYVDLSDVFTNNQVSPVFISNKGRFICSVNSFRVSFFYGKITVEGEEIVFGREKDMKAAHKKIAELFFVKSPSPPPDILFSEPCYNTWIVLGYNQNESGILSYAQSIIDAGLPAGELIIDCGWQEYYGKWDFHPGKFKDPSGMIEKLHFMGFKVVLWYVPFISPDSEIGRDYSKRGLLIKKIDGKPYLAEWWDGYSFVLDFTNPETKMEFEKITDDLVKKYGIDGIKQDGGDMYFYRKDNVCYSSSMPEKQCALYAREAERFSFNELRSCFGEGGRSIIMRTADRHHSWDAENGLKSLIPICLLQGLLGYPFNCPDMIGGGDFGSFLSLENKFNEELFIRYCQIAAFMPALQLSFDFWYRLSEKTFEICKAYCTLRCRLSSVFIKLKNRAYLDFIPMAVLPEYFGKDYYTFSRDVFFFGENILVAPITEEGAINRRIYLPEGNWLYYGKKLQGGKEYIVAAPLHVLPVFEREESGINAHKSITALLPGHDFTLFTEFIND